MHCYCYVVGLAVIRFDSNVYWNRGRKMLSTVKARWISLFVLMTVHKAIHVPVIMEPALPIFAHKQANKKKLKIYHALYAFANRAKKKKIIIILNNFWRCVRTNIVELYLFWWMLNIHFIYCTFGRTDNGPQFLQLFFSCSFCAFFSYHKKKVTWIFTFAFRSYKQIFVFSLPKQLFFVLTLVVFPYVRSFTVQFYCVRFGRICREQFI